MMNVLIGDLMASADEEYRPRGRKKKSKKRDGRKKKKKARGERCHRSEDDRLHGDESRFLTGPSARSGMTKGPESLRPESLRKEKWLPPKRMGELSELDFLRKAMGMGMIVSKPWGDSYRYDFVCDTGRRLWRAQVRS